VPRLLLTSAENVGPSPFDSNLLTLTISVQVHDMLYVGSEKHLPLACFQAYPDSQCWERRESELLALSYSTLMHLCQCRLGFLAQENF